MQNSQSLQKDVGDKTYEDAQKAISELKKQKKDVQDNVVELEKNKEIYAKATNSRCEFMRLLKYGLEKMVNSAFKKLIQKRFNKKLRAELIVDFKVSTAKLKVERVDTDGEIHGEIDVQTLSGGEKSALLVSFIEALWKAMSSPFRCLDEWDVFLDERRRDEIGNKIVEAARNTNNQYIFISPQNVVVKEVNEYVKVVVVEQNKDR